MESPPQDDRKPLGHAHEQHCFVVMPYGRTEVEARWFRGWYKAVIEVAVREAGYEPILSADEQRPEAINDEVRKHLAYDPMVVVDLGGSDVSSEPNPNVMYELGIRHALNLPVVLMAWRGQRLPFDISNQRVILEARDFLEMETNRAMLVRFIEAAEQGYFYRPMEAVVRSATLEAAASSLDRDSVLRALVQEVRDLRRDLRPREEVSSPTVIYERAWTPEEFAERTSGEILDFFERELLPQAYERARKEWEYVEANNLPEKIRSRAFELAEQRAFSLGLGDAWKKAHPP